MSSISLSLFRMFMRFINDGPSVPDWHGYLIGLAMALFTALGFLLNFQSSDLIWQLRVKIESCLNAAIYRKILRLKKSAWKGFTVGEILNLMSIHASIFGRVTFFMGPCWTVPVRLTLSTILLHWTVGDAAFVGLGSWFIVLLDKF